MIYSAENPKFTKQGNDEPPIAPIYQKDSLEQLY